MPVIVLNTLEGKEHPGAPDAIPERKAEYDGGVEILVFVAAVDCAPMGCGHLADTEVLLCWKEDVRRACVRRTGPSGLPLISQRDLLAVAETASLPAPPSWFYRCWRCELREASRCCSRAHRVASG